MTGCCFSNLLDIYQTADFAVYYITYIGVNSTPAACTRRQEARTHALLPGFGAISPHLNVSLAERRRGGHLWPKYEYGRYNKVGMWYTTVPLLCKVLFITRIGGPWPEILGGHKVTAKIIWGAPPLELLLFLACPIEKF